MTSTLFKRLEESGIMRNRSKMIRVGLLCGALLAGGFGPLSSWAQDAEQADGLVKGGDPAGLIMAFTGDVIGFLDPCG
jgi:hypothetical protein